MSIWIKIYIFNFRNWLTLLWGPASWNFIGKACRLEARGGADVVVLRPKAAWRQSSFFLGDLDLFLVKPSTDWIRRSDM